MDIGDRVQVRYTRTVHVTRPTTAIDGIARYLFAVIVSAIGAATVAGCDGSSTPDGTPVTGADSASGTAVGTAAIADGPTSPNDGSISLALQRDLSARLVRDGEVLDMTPNSSKRFLTPQELAKSDTRPGADRQYEQEGVEGAASVHLDSSRSADAISTVLKFRSAAGARGDLSTAADVPEADKATTFDVPGIAEAIGVDVYLDGKLVGRNVSFVAGPYEYIIGFASDPAVGEAWTRGQLAAAAGAWYHRVSAD